MQVKITNRTALKGKGFVDVGTTLTEKDADPIELKRLVAYGKAEYVNAIKSDDKPKIEDKPKVDLTKGLSTKTAGALK